MSSDRAISRFGAGQLARALVFCALACIVHGPSAQAEDAEAATTAEYRELIDQALSEFKHKNWPEARVLFRRAHELSPSARTLRGMGIVSYEMRDYVGAVVALSAALDDTRQPLTEAQREESAKLLARARTFVGSFALSVEPADADVTIDGGPVVRDAQGRALVPFGEHTLRASAKGFDDATRKLAVEGGEQRDLQVALTRTPVLGAGEPAAIRRETPVAGATLPPGGAPTRPLAPLEEPAPGRVAELRYTWIALGTSAVLGAAAAGFWVAGKTKLDDLDASCARAASTGAPCRPGEVDTAAVQRFERLTNAMIGLSGAALLASGVLLAIEWPRERRVSRTPARRLALDVLPQRLAVRGTF